MAINQASTDGDNGVNSAGDHNQVAQAINNIHVASLSGFSEEDRRDYFECNLARGQSDEEGIVGELHPAPRRGRIYVPLACHSVSDKVWQQRKERSADQLSDEFADADNGLVLAEMIAQQKYSVVLGQAGAGKSSFLLHVLAQCCGARLALDAGQAKAGDIASHLGRLAAALPGADKDKEKEQAGQRLAAVAKLVEYLPVHVTLREFIASQTAPENSTAAEELATPEVFLKWLLEYRNIPANAQLANAKVLLLLDGLDEVPDAEGRRQQLCQLIQQCKRRFSQWRIVVTARPYAYLNNKEWRLLGFQTLHIKDFNNGQIEAFCQAWYGFLGAPDGAAQHLHEQVSNSTEQIRKLAAKPLLLDMIAQVHQQQPDKALPTTRAALYDSLLSLPIVERTEKFDSQHQAHPGYSSWSQLYNAQANAGCSEGQVLLRELGRLAWSTHERQQGQNNTSAGDIRLGELFEWLVSCPGVNDDWPHMQMIRYLGERAAIVSEVLQGKAPSRFGFVHRSFQEYLAALYMAEVLEPLAVVKKLVAAPGHWREVLKFYLPRLALLEKLQGDQGLLALIKAELVEQKDCQLTLPEACLFITEALAEVGPIHLTNLAQARRSELQQGLLELMRSDCVASERALAGELLSQLGDPRFYPAPSSPSDIPALPNSAEHPLGFIAVRGGQFTLGDGGDDDCPAHEAEVEPFWMARWPVTVAQFRAFASQQRDKDYQGFSHWKLDHHPATNISWLDARDYCVWLDGWLRNYWLPARDKTPAEQALAEAIKAQNLRLRLPSEVEWEYAARGRDGHRYAFGGEFASQADGQPDYREANINSVLGKVVPVGSYAHWPTDLGIEDLTGNVWEWTRSAYAGANDYPYPALGSEQRKRREKWLNVKTDERRVLRGGGGWDDVHLARACFRLHFHSDFRNGGFGFRMVLSPSPLDSDPLNDEL